MVLCSQCSSHVKPIVAFDIDGTLGDYHGHFTWFCSKYFDKPYLAGLRPYPGVGEFEEWLDLTKQQYREAKLAYRQGGMKRWLPIYPRAKEAVDAVRKAGADIWIATTRPWQRLDNIDPDTREWLRRNDLHVEGLLYGEDKYRQLCETVDVSRIVAVIDDLPEQVYLASGMDLPTILRTNHHNKAWASENPVPQGTLDVCREWACWRVTEWYDAQERERHVHT